MIKELFLTVALLAPGIAYGGNPSGDLSVEVVPTSPNGIVCDIGPAYTGAIPAAAQAAGFTHCAANFDFTSSANFIYNGNTYNFSQPSTWLDCAGASSPLLYNTGYYPGPTPCSDFKIVSHGGTNVLDITYTPTDARTQEMSWLSTDPNTGGGRCNSTCPFTVPNGHYADITVGSNTQTLQAYNDGTQHDSISYFSGTAGAPAQYMEWDVTELFINDEQSGSPTTGAGGCVYWSPSTNYVCSTTDWQVFNTSIDYTQFNTYGQLATSDGTTNMAKCGYLNNQQVYCSSWNMSGSSAFTTRYTYGGGLGDQNRFPPTIPVNSMDIYVKSMTFWEPPGCAWQSSQCNTAIYTGP